MISFGAWAQRTITGTVTSAEDGSEIPGVNVIVKGTTTGTTTDLDGRFQLNVADDATTLVFTFIGLNSQEVEIGSRSTIDVAMTSDVKELQEVVVTALGISQDRKALGYGVASLDEQSLTNRQELDVARLLRGKATGVNIQQTSGLSGSGTNVIIRGYSSITGSNQPLFVVDGIPFNTDTNNDQGFGAGGATASSRFLDLDPNTIENVSILKGLSATVLYGEAGRNGVILVTTTNGSGGANAQKKAEVSVRQSVYRSEVANLPDYQNTFGNGFNAGFGWFFSNWGAAFDDLRPSSYGNDFQGLTPDGTQVLITHPYDQAQYNDDFPEYIGADYIYQPYESVENFFDPGWSSSTSVGVKSRLNENSTLSLTYSYLTDQGYTPKKSNGDRSNYVDKNNFGLGGQTTLANGLSLKGSFNFVDTKREVPLTGQAFGGDGNGLFAAILFTPRSMDLMGLPYQSPIDGSNVYYRRGSPIQNPRWVLNNAGQTEAIRRFFSSTQAGYEINENLSLLYRLSYDTYDQTNTRFINKGGPQVPNGEMGTFNRNNTLIDQILNVVYNYRLPGDITIDGIVGFNQRRETNRINGTQSTQQFVYNIFSHQNFSVHNSFSGVSEENTLGLYGTATVGLPYGIFVNLQARNDWTSTLEQENRSNFYPSASASFVPTDVIPGLDNSKVVDYLKVRFGIGISKGYPDPYRTRSVLDANTNVFVAQGGNSLNTNSVSNFLGNRNLEAEEHQELELGIEGRFFNNFIGVDLSLYNKTSSNLIVTLPLDPSTGYTSTSSNAAEVQNRGIELGLNVNPPIPGPIQWDFIINFTKNISEVKEILGGLDQVGIAGFGNGLGNYAIPGEPFGVMQGSAFTRVEDVFDDDGNNLTNYGDQVGKLVVDGQGNYFAAGGIDIIGDPNQNYRLNWINNLSWKGLSFGFQWEYIDGSSIYSSTVQALLARGNTVDTDVDRNIPLVMPNSVKQQGTDDNGNPVYVENDIQTYIGDSFFRAYFFANEGGVFDATVIRLREVSLSYVLPKEWLENTPFGTLGLTLSGENLWYDAPNFPEGINFDPEISSTGVGNGRGFDFRTAPTVKKYGATLNLTF